MKLADLIAASSTLGSCDVAISGIEKLYLVPLGDGFSTLFRTEIITELPDIEAIPIDVNIDFESCNFKSRKRTTGNGTYYDNSITFSLGRNVSAWIYANQEKRFWAIFKKGGKWYISGDEALPYTIAQDFTTGKAPGEKHGFDVELTSSQLRPFFKYVEPVYTLSGTDWEELTPYAGAWAGSSAAFNLNDYLSYNGNAYQRTNTDVFTDTTPDANADYNDLGTLQNWLRTDTYAIDDLVLLDDRLYINLTGNNNYTRTITE